METYKEPDIPQSEISQDERLLAFVCQIIVPLFTSAILYFVMKDSRFIRFYALQSICFNCIALILIGLSVGIMYLSTITENFVVIFLTFFALFVWIIPIVVIVYGIIIGVYAFKGKIKKYPIIGKWAFNKIYPEMRVKPPSINNYSTSSFKPSSKGLI